MIRSKRALGVVAALGVIGTAVAVLLSVRHGHDAATVLSVGGSVASLFGLVAVLIELMSLNAVADATRAAVEQTRNEIALSVSHSDIARAIRSAEQVQSYGGAGKYEVAHMRLQDVRALLLLLSGTPQFAALAKPKRFSELLSAVGVDLASLYECTHDASLPFDSRQLHESMERVIKLLVHLDGQLRFNGGRNHG